MYQLIDGRGSGVPQMMGDESVPFVCDSGASFPCVHTQCYPVEANYNDDLSYSIPYSSSILFF